MHVQKEAHELSEYCHTFYHFQVAYETSIARAEVWLNHPVMGRFAHFLMLVGNYSFDYIADDVQYEPGTVDYFIDFVAKVHYWITKNKDMCFPVINGWPRLCLAPAEHGLYSQLTFTETHKHKEGRFTLRTRHYLKTFDEYVDAAWEKFAEDSPEVIADLPKISYSPTNKNPTVWPDDI